MGFNLFGKKKDTLYSLNELGRHKSEEMIGQHGLRLKVVNYLDEHGESSVSEISSGLNVPRESAKIMVEKLVREQWVTPVKSPSSD